MEIATNAEEQNFVARVAQQKRRQTQDFCEELRMQLLTIASPNLFADKE